MPGSWPLPHVSGRRTGRCLQNPQFGLRVQGSGLKLPGSRSRFSCPGWITWFGYLPQINRLEEFVRGVLYASEISPPRAVAARGCAAMRAQEGRVSEVVRSSGREVEPSTQNAGFEAFAAEWC